MKLNRVLLIIVSFILCTHFGDPFSKNKREKPEVNFYGTLFYPDGQAVDVENITIGRMIRDIVVFQKPSSFPPPAPLPNQPSTNPIEIESNRTKLSLDKICQINTLNPLIIYNNRNYVEIEVVSNDPTNTRNIFLIEQRKELACNLKKSGFDKEVSLSALKSVSIKGRKSRIDEESTTHTFKNCDDSTICGETHQQIPADIDMLITKTNLLIQELQAKSDELPQSSLKDTIKSLISELKKAFMYLFS